MTYETEAYRRPHRRGDFHLVDTTREGTYWHSPDGIVVRMAVLYEVLAGRANVPAPTAEPSIA